MKAKDTLLFSDVTFRKYFNEKSLVLACCITCRLYMYGYGSNFCLNECIQASYKTKSWS